MTDEPIEQPSKPNRIERIKYWAILLLGVGTTLFAVTSMRDLFLVGCGAFIAFMLPKMNLFGPNPDAQ
jgi:hypothetical protein